jgi:hypothetical protein
MEKLNFRKPNSVKVEEQYQINISYTFTALETWIIMWTSVGLGKMLERRSNLQPQRVLFMR